MWLGPSNQLIQIDTGKARTYLYNKSLSPISVYSDIGEAQVLGQRYVGASNAVGFQSVRLTGNLHAGEVPFHLGVDHGESDDGRGSGSGLLDRQHLYHGHRHHD